ncbi:MAG: hypothetical protein U0800_23590 [Isosphaeraceae bacterium]
MVVSTIRERLRLAFPCLLAMLPMGCDGGPPPIPTPAPAVPSAGGELQQGKARKAVPKGVEEFDDLKERRAKNRTKPVSSP